MYAKRYTYIIFIDSKFNTLKLLEHALCVYLIFRLYYVYSDFNPAYLLLSQSHNTGLTTGSDDSSLVWIHIGVPVILVVVLLVIIAVACLFAVNVALKRHAVTHGRFKKGFFFTYPNGTELKRRNEGSFLKSNMF